ncbi:RNA-guided pseudouridylation complex pseudouridine synthase subunit Cbf5, partial [Candidatus Woesearchaeota archaeon]|nr:RNA-guided pseudouridylation complex pseudouridine synthase subunit Cbf5 [Candidatus Woesearchaeota archaeon]
FEKIQREVLVRNESKTSSKYGMAPEKRSVEELIDYGIINMDKPPGPTSHQVSAFVQKILKIKKSGHSGTLDPKVTGVLPIATQRATRIVQTLLNAGKEYVCLMHLHNEVKETELRKVIKEFTGKIKQLPPIKSAVKRQWRYRKVYYIEILDIIGQDVLFKVGSQAGTYIRKLVHDIGEKLGVGAHMAQLRRTKAGPFDESNVVTLHDLTDAYHFYKEEDNEKFIRHCIKPVEFAVDHIPKVWVFDSTINSVCHGANLKVPGISKVHSKIQKEEVVAIMSLKDELVAIGTSNMTSKEMLKEKGIAVTTQKVFMNTSTYPKLEK